MTRRLACRSAAILFAGLVLAAPLLAGKFNEVLSIGDKAPAWPALPSVEGRSRSLQDFDAANILVVAFMANRCPMTAACEERFKRFAADYKDRGVAFVGISVSRFPADDFEKMQARAVEREYNFPYLHDPSQVVGRRYGATHTPHLFVLDRERKIVYMGAFDDNPLAADKVEVTYVRLAVNALLANQPIEIRETRQKGCEIEYAADTPQP